VLTKNCETLLFNKKQPDFMMMQDEEVISQDSEKKELGVLGTLKDNLTVTLGKHGELKP
jgi:hypothetical protein